SSERDRRNAVDLDDGRRSARASVPLTRPGRTRVSRRIPAHVGALATAVGTLELVQRLAWIPERASGAGTPPPDVQFDLDAAVPSPVVVDGVQVRFGPIHTIFVTFALSGTPTRADQRTLAGALDAVERHYPYPPRGCVTHVAYGLPCCRRLPPGLVALHMPRLLADNARFVLEEAAPGPADTDVRIERNDLLVT